MHFQLLLDQLDLDQIQIIVRYDKLILVPIDHVGIYF